MARSKASIASGGTASAALSCMRVWLSYAGRRRRNLAGLALGLLVGMTSIDAEGATSYGYDSLGRLTSVLYDNGLCTVYSYDANGNRTSQTSYETPQVSPALWGAETWGSFVWSSAPQWPVWGSGAVWGCFKWTPP
jgi:YD repeat-containing protein